METEREKYTNMITILKRGLEQVNKEPVLRSPQIPRQSLSIVGVITDPILALNPELSPIQNEELVSYRINQQLKQRRLTLVR